jgi:hypothetical protein
MSSSQSAVTLASPDVDAIGKGNQQAGNMDI